MKTGAGEVWSIEGGNVRIEIPSLLPHTQQPALALTCANPSKQLVFHGKEVQLAVAISTQSPHSSLIR